MLSRVLLTAAFLSIASLGIDARPVVAQGVGGLVKKVKTAAEDEATRQVQRRVRDAVACAFDDPRCIEEAKEAGEPVVLTDREGNVIEDENGNPITDPEAAEAATQKPGEGVWANYDFVPGDRVLFAEDYTAGDVGDFPRRLRFLNGNMEIVEWNGTRWLRATAGSTFAIELDETLPEQFTLEFPISWDHGNQWMRVLFAAQEGLNPRPRGVSGYKPAHLQIDERNTGIQDFQGDGPFSLSQIRGKITDGPATIRLMADGEHVKVFVNERRVANVPQVELGREPKVWFLIADAKEDLPMFVGPIRLAAGGRDLYDRLEAEGSVATRGILFDVDSDRIRPESTPTLEEIGGMLEDHPELRISIVGHTDSDGDDSYNADLSERRANAVREYMIQTYGIDSDRLESEGKGESEPVADNATPEGKQQNRRVELIKLG
jgi:outer membrane protein OmpA-like peptidoglycan-associated protein